MCAKLLLIEDDEGSAEALREEMSAFGHGVEVSLAVDPVLQRAGVEEYDLLLVSRLSLGMDGLRVISSLRRSPSSALILILTAIEGLGHADLLAAGDAYLIKPFRMVELRARVEELLRRASFRYGPILRVGCLALDPQNRKVVRGARVLDLLPGEFKLLEYMALRSDCLLTGAMILEDVWSLRFPACSDLADAHVERLRHKVDLPGEEPLIMSMPGAGYCLRKLPPE